jgi:hypothetical protein
MTDEIKSCEHFARMAPNGGVSSRLGVSAFPQGIQSSFPAEILVLNKYTELTATHPTGVK